MICNTAYLYDHTTHHHIVFFASSALSIVTPNLQSAVYCTGIAKGGEAAWNFAWDQYLTSSMEVQKDKLLNPMGCAEEPWILTR